MQTDIGQKISEHIHTRLLDWQYVEHERKRLDTAGLQFNDNTSQMQPKIVLLLGIVLTKVKNGT